jgi:3-oxoacyl-[acyl-carrier-protein] synthase III
MSGKYAITGLGLTAQGKVYEHGYMGFGVEAVTLALADAGLQKTALDGLLVNPGLSWRNASMASSTLQHALGLENLSFSASMNLGGATAGAMIQQAAAAIEAGLATTVACVFSDSPLRAPDPDKKNGKGS